jgi:uncharacterized protein (DUF1810 family)
MGASGFYLDRFHQAQDRGAFAAALDELRRGRKEGHWIWFVFPQLAGLGSSAMAQRFGLDGIAEARAYFQDFTLRGRLIESTSALQQGLERGSTHLLRDVLGSEIDAMKVVSSLTLFRAIARTDTEKPGEPFAAAPVSSFVTTATELLYLAAAQGFPECGFTLDRLSTMRG